jgi:predicted DsbA family dithiol-disulfide isomerase
MQAVRSTASGHQIVEVWADACCPFTHVGLRRFVERRAELGRPDVIMRVRAWPLELVNGAPLDAAFIGEEIEELREQVSPQLFEGFSVSSFPSSSIPAMALAAAAYRVGDHTGEAVSLRLRDLLFEEGADIADAAVLAAVAAAFDLDRTVLDSAADGRAAIDADYEEGLRRGVVGSPHFFTAAGSFFCPALDISRDAESHLVIAADPTTFEAMIADAFASSA